MSLKEITDSQEAIVRRVNRCIKRFEKIEKIQKQPWRDFEATSDIQSIVILLNELVYQGAYDEEKTNAILRSANENARTLETIIKIQNAVKYHGLKLD